MSGNRRAFLAQLVLVPMGFAVGCDRQRRGTQEGDSEEKRVVAVDLATLECVEFRGGTASSYTLTDTEWRTLQTREQPYELSLVNVSLRDDHFWRLTGNEAIRSLRIEGAHTLTDDVVRYLAQLPNLERLILMDCSVTNVAIAKLSEISSLRWLELRRCEKLTGPGLAPLGKQSSLEELHLEGIGDLRGVDFQPLLALKRLRGLTLCGGGIFNQDLKQLSVLSSLESLTLSCPNVTGDGVRELRNLPNLRAVALHCGGIQDDVAKSILMISTLRDLNLSGCHQIGDSALTDLGTMQSLRGLELEDCNRISDEGVAQLANLVGLETLNLGGCERLTGKSLRVIAKMTQLETLNLRGWIHLKGPDLELLTPLTRIRSLNLEGCLGVPDTDLSYLRSMKELEEIILANGNYSNLAASLLSEFPKLRRADLHNSRISDGGLNYLVPLPNLTELDLSGCLSVRDEGAVLLAEQKSLRLLWLPGSVSEDTVRELRRTRPECGIFIVDRFQRSP